MQVARADHLGGQDDEERRLVVIIGPIASGKSTLAAELAGRLRRAGEAVAVVGLDTVAEMALPTPEQWPWAHDVHGQVVGAWLATPIARVIAEGPATPAEVDQLLRHVPRHVSVLRVLLVTRFEAALGRAIGDPTRGLSKNPEFLLAMYRHFESELPGLVYDVRLDSEQDSPGRLADRVLVALQAGGP